MSTLFYASFSATGKWLAGYFLFYLSDGTITVGQFMSADNHKGFIKKF